MTNYDLNIWDKLSYETSGAETGGWVITPYEPPTETGGSYGSGRMRDDLSIELTPIEAFELTLGVAPFDGGRYAEDEDFWLDRDGFLNIYEGVIPPRVESLLKALPD